MRNMSVSVYECEPFYSWCQNCLSCILYNCFLFMPIIVHTRLNDMQRAYLLD
jgi:hypothetical protein